MEKERKERRRSPNYPYIGLSRAIELIGKIYDKEKNHSVSAEVLAKDIGYGGINGISASILSAIKKFGLLEGSTSSMKLTELALKIIHPKSDSEKQKALKDAALTPPLFSELFKEYGERPPSDEAIKAFLVRDRQFQDSAADNCIKNYRETVATISTGVEKNSDLITEEAETQASYTPLGSLSDRPGSKGGPFNPHTYIERTVLSSSTSVELHFSKEPTISDFEALADYIEFRKKWLGRNRLNDAEEGRKE